MEAFGKYARKFSISSTQYNHQQHIQMSQCILCEPLQINFCTMFQSLLLCPHLPHDPDPKKIYLWLKIIEAERLQFQFNNPPIVTCNINQCILHVSESRNKWDNNNYSENPKPSFEDKNTPLSMAQTHSCDIKMINSSYFGYKLYFTICGKEVAEDRATL